MGLFSAPKHAAVYFPNSGMMSQPELHRRGSNETKESKEPKETASESDHSSGDGKPDEMADTKDEENNPEEESLKEKKVTKVKNKDKFDPETSKNTRFNSLIFHTSDDTVDLYAKENNSSDLLGRIYYDDFDSDSITSPISSVTNTPLLSPTITGVSSDYFTLGNVQPNFSRIPSATNLRNLGSTISVDEKFKSGVSFDVSGNSAKKSLTLKVKHPKFKFRRNNKTFLSGYNNDHESLRAIRWLFDEMIINGDTIVILQVLDEKFHDNIDKKQAQVNLNKIEQLNAHNKKISIVFEIVVGKPQKLLEKAIDEFKPQMMCIGTHQDEEVQHKSIFAKTPLSKFFLQYALVPVVIVKPKYNHIETLTKPIDSIDYFKNWLIEISDASIKEKKKKSRPGYHRANSLEDRGRTADSKLKLQLSPSQSRSGSRSRSESPLTAVQSLDERSSSKGRHRLSKLFH